MAPSKTPSTLSDGGLKIYDDGSDEPRWLEARKGLYTATQVTAIVGSNPYTKIIDVWNERTDPEFDPEAGRNRWLEERAAFGSARESEIIKWASADPRTGGPGNPFQPSHALVGLPELEAKSYACTPDGFKFARDNVLVLIECKASQQNWEADGIPQHIYDQIQWQLYTTGAVTVWLAQELVKWVGRGVTKHAEVIGTYLIAIQPDAKRLAWMLAKVEQFESDLRAGIAPESDIDLRELEAPDFDATAEDLADYVELEATRAKLNEVAEIDRRAKADADRRKVLAEEIKGTVTKYAGRRIWLISDQFTAKLTRGTKSNVDTKSLPADTLRGITSWSETETLRMEPNPEYVAPSDDTEPTKGASA